MTATPLVAPVREPAFFAEAPFDARPSATLVIYCADGRFRPQTHEFLTRHLKLDRPVTITVPGGVGVFMPLVGLAHKIAKGWLDAFSEHITRIVVVAHEDCAAYRAEHGILEKVVLRLVGKPVAELQREHLSRAVAQLRVWYPHATTETYYAAVTDGPEGARRVAFTPVA
jgi:hypothetical protein